MRIAVLGESPADEAAIKILVDGILGDAADLVTPPPLRSRGWPAVVNLIPAVLKHLHYRTDAEALVVVVDSDDSPVHQTSHDEPGGENLECRLCQLRHVIALVMSDLPPLPNRTLIRTAVGVAVPAIEAWYRAAADPHVNEATWIRRLSSQTVTYTRRSLKQDVYGTDRPSLEHATRHATAAALRLARDIPLLERLFPNSFGPFVQAIRSW